MTKRTAVPACACIVSLVFTFLSTLRAQEYPSHRVPEKCQVKAKEPNAPEYRVGKAWPTGEKPVEVYLLISVEPEHFSKDKMIALAHQLKKDFCEETRFGVVIIFDEYRAARYVTYLSITRDLEKAQRGFYHLDRQKKQEYIQFSTNRGKPTDEVKIDLTKEPQ
jgi:hypothetical protein